MNEIYTSPNEWAIDEDYYAGKIEWLDSKLTESHTAELSTALGMLRSLKQSYDAYKGVYDAIVSRDIGRSL